MRSVEVLCLILAGALSLAAQVSGSQQSRSGSPTGMRGGFTERPRSTSTSKVFEKAARLVHLTPDQLSKEYSADASTCAVTPKSYLALLLAQERLKLDRHRALKEMCDQKTNSFAKALSANGTLKMQLSGVTNAQDLYAAETLYRDEIDQAIKNP
jgi:hypothetical protein